ncbi:hypothetical protein QFC21_000602 [Naganishia friedmannii]|uniref:Uncharacterized protein n=1 Tax=Naganishia friedmannii TaxID=89922 RepID=A0ACC2WCR5_9TREE|nr:hypothetical protein QFC21_000602 [Naganishia friedmannii]
MGFFRQHVWSPRPALASSMTQLEPSDSDQSFTNFPVNQETKHPLRRISSNSLASSVLAHSNKENIIRLPVPTLTYSGGSTVLDLDHQSAKRLSVATLRQSAPSIRTLTVEESASTEDASDSRTLGLRRKLSKVRSLADMRFPRTTTDSRNSSSPRRPEVKADRSSFHPSIFRSPQEGGAKFPSPALDEQQLQASPPPSSSSAFSSFVKRKMSSDSSMRVAFKKQARSASPEVASISIISLPTLYDKSAAPPNDTVLSVTLEPESSDQSLTSHSTLPAFSFESDCQRSDQSSSGSAQHFYYLLPDIMEEMESRRDSIDRNFRLASDPIVSTASDHPGSDQCSVTLPNA